MKHSTSNTSLKPKSEYSLPSLYYKELYLSLKRNCVSVLRYVRDNKFLPNPHEGLEIMLRFYTLASNIKEGAERDAPEYWRNGVVRLSDIAMKRTVDKLFNYYWQNK